MDRFGWVDGDAAVKNIQEKEKSPPNVSGQIVRCSVVVTPLFGRSRILGTRQAGCGWRPHRLGTETEKDVESVAILENCHCLVKLGSQRLLGNHHPSCWGLLGGSYGQDYLSHTPCYLPGKQLVWCIVLGASHLACLERKTKVSSWGTTAHGDD